MPTYRFEVLDCASDPAKVVDRWERNEDDDEAAWTVASMVMLSDHQQVLVYRPGQDVAFESKVSDPPADEMGV